MRALNNWEPLADTMGISYANVQRMLVAVVAITIITAIMTRKAFTTAWTAIALSAIVGFIWGVSHRETTFKQTLTITMRCYDNLPDTTLCYRVTYYTVTCHTII